MPKTTTTMKSTRTTFFHFFPLLLVVVNYLPSQNTHGFSTTTSFLTTTTRKSATAATTTTRRRRGTSTSRTATSTLSTMSSAAQSQLPKNIVVIGGGIQGTSVAYYLSKHLAKAKADANNTDDTTSTTKTTTTIKILEAKAPASAASGKGGGFMARSWGDGSPTQSLHHLGFDLYSQLSSKNELDLKSYRTLPVLSVSPGTNKKGMERARSSNKVGSYMPNWLDGYIGNVGLMGRGDDTAQVTPSEVVEKMIDSSSDLVEVVLGECVGIDASDIDGDGDDEDGDGDKKVEGVRYIPRGETEEKVLEADVVVVSAGPWSCKAEDWFGNVIDLPMEGVKSTSIVWKKPSGVDGDDGVDATALFCGEDNRFGTHLEVYPRPDGTIYICGIGGSDYIPTDELKGGAYREECNAKESRVEAASNAFQTMSNTYKVSGELEKVQACMRPCPPDAMPYMGKIPGYDGAYVNAGHNCWGIAWAPSCGLAMAELILEGESKSVDLRYFNPARFTTKVGGGRGRKRRGQSVGEQW